MASACPEDTDGRSGDEDQDRGAHPDQRGARGRVPSAERRGWAGATVAAARPKPTRNPLAIPFGRRGEGDWMCAR